MLPYGLFVGYFSLIAAALFSAQQSITRQANLLSIEVEQAAVESFSTAVLDFYEANRAYPADLAAMAATPGFEYAQSFNLPNVFYRLSPDLDSTSFTFRRASVAWVGFENARDRLTAAEFFSGARNQCGANSFEQNGSWCGPVDGYWWKHESRWDSAQNLEGARADLTRTLAKFASIFSSNNPYVFPGQLQGLNPGDTVQLAQLIGAPLTSAACNASVGIFPFDGYDFDCSDLYIAESGLPVFYTFVDPYYIVLSGETAEFNGLGERMVVSQEMLAE